MGRRTLTIGTFDLLHHGHLHLLAEAARLGGDLHVGVNTDEFVTSYKGRTPVVPFADRLLTVTAVPGVDQAHPNRDAGHTLIKAVAPHYLVVGTDWHRRDYLTQIGMTLAELEEHDCALVYVPYTEGVSTTTLRERLRP